MFQPQFEHIMKLDVSSPDKISRRDCKLHQIAEEVCAD